MCGNYWWRHINSYWPLHTKFCTRSLEECGQTEKSMSYWYEQYLKVIHLSWGKFSSVQPLSTAHVCKCLIKLGEMWVQDVDWWDPDVQHGQREKKKLVISIATSLRRKRKKLVAILMSEFMSCCFMSHRIHTCFHHSSHLCWVGRDTMFAGWNLIAV